jgi:lysophospholipase L1-like esterase
MTVDGAIGASQPVTYPTPTVSNGSTPVNVTCAPASGSMFPIGETIVTCTAVDAIARQASCTFGVTVRHRQLALTNYLAFGDSQTEGQNGQRFNFIPIVDRTNAYPTILQQLFTSRIPGQPIVVVNAGLSGERVTENEDRLKQTLDAVRPQVLLFLEGANDMLASAPPQEIAEGVRESIKRARDRGVQYIFVSTLLPVAPANCQPGGPPCKSVPPGLPAATNQLIRSLVPANGAHLVDPYDEFVANSATYISIDGLHLTADGNRALASAFWNRIVIVIPAKQLSATGLFYR